MSGHSKWATIKRQKGVADARRSAVFTKHAKRIAAAARAGKNPTMNFRLRLAIDRARAVNMPNENVERAIKSGSGELRGQEEKEALYEGFGPGGVALLVQALTDNPNRTAAEIRSLFTKHGGNLGSANSVAWMFQLRGILRLPPGSVPADLDKLQLALIDLGAEDVQLEENDLIIQTPSEKLATVRDWLRDQRYEITEADLAFIPETTVAIENETMTQQLHHLLDALDEHDDVTTVYSNDV